MAVAIPAGEESPIVLDASFAAAARGKVKVYHQKGIPLPEGWAFDSEGKPTTDTKVALDGLLQPIGRHKGYGFALVVGILSAVLSGALFGTELGDVVNGSKPGRDGHFFIALKVAAFEDVARFQAADRRHYPPDALPLAVRPGSSASIRRVRWNLSPKSSTARRESP